jgi:Putative peptidoglycan binding domain
VSSILNFLKSANSRSRRQSLLADCHFAPADRNVTGLNPQVVRVTSSQVSLPARQVENSKLGQHRVVTHTIIIRATTPAANAPIPTTAPLPLDQQANPTVSAVQSRLAQLGYYDGVVDGLFGPDTRAALTRYQIDHRLSVTASLTTDTLQSLGIQKMATS